MEAGVEQEYFSELTTENDKEDESCIEIKLVS